MNQDNKMTMSVNRFFGKLTNTFIHGLVNKLKLICEFDQKDNKTKKDIIRKMLAKTDSTIKIPPIVQKFLKQKEQED